MSLRFCVPVIPSVDLEKTLRLWVDGFGFTPSSEMHEHGKLIFCMLNKDEMWFIVNRRAGSPDKPNSYEGIRLYWTPDDLRETRERLKSLGYAVSEPDDRSYGQTEFLLADDDGYSHCFGVPTEKKS